MSASPLRQSTVKAGPVSPRGQLPQAVHQEVRVHSQFLSPTLSLSLTLSLSIFLSHTHSLTHSLTDSISFPSSVLQTDKI